MDDSGGKIQKRHIESIHEGKTFKCDICLSSFKYKGYLKKHVGSFYEGKRFKFGACHSSFTQKVAWKHIFNQFMKEEHLNVIFVFSKFTKNKLEKENLIQMKKNGVNQVDSFIDTTDVLSHFVCVNFFSKVVWLDLLELGS